jgi:hypothetical protein
MSSTYPGRLSLHGLPLARSLSIAALAVAVAACAANTRNNVTGGGSGDDSGGLETWNPQGTDLLAAPTALEPFSVATTGWTLNGAPVASVELVELELRLDGRADVAGAHFTATAPDGSSVAMQIVAVVPHKNPWNGPPSPVRHVYAVSYQAGGAWTPLCGGDAVGAMAIPGEFAINPKQKGPVSNGDYHFSRDRLTFSCRDGVAAKCIDWGYPPRGADPDLSRYFQACTRMARADYCGTGHSRTVPGTVINYSDLHDPPIVPAIAAPGMVPEAVWGLGDGTQGQPAAICLSRTRWSTIPIGDRSPCADLLPPPSSDPAGPKRFCDEQSADDWKANGALFVNRSRMLDTGLARWTDGAGHYATTTRFPWLGDATPSTGPAGYASFVAIEGSVYKPTPLPPAAAGTVPLYSYTRKAGDVQLWLTTTDPAAGDGYTDRTLEAYVFGPSAESPAQGAQRLVLYRDAGGSFATITADEPAPTGFAQVAVLGWLPH